VKRVSTSSARPAPPCWAGYFAVWTVFVRTKPPENYRVICRTKAYRKQDWWRFFSPLPPTRCLSQNPRQVPYRRWHAGSAALLPAHHAPTRNCSLAVRRGCGNSPIPIAETRLNCFAARVKSPSPMSPNTSGDTSSNTRSPISAPRTSLSLPRCSQRLHWTQRRPPLIAALWA
jgi:hypothetical protein